MKSVLTLSLVTLLCTCGLAQSVLSQFPRDDTNVAFIKGKTGYLIDSITIRTSLDTIPYGFAFPDDTLILDISIFRPVDKLTLETFAGNHSFGEQQCWVDAPSADLHLSIFSGRTTIDSVRLSPIDEWYRREISNIKQAFNINTAKSMVINAAYNSTELLIVADFLDIYTNLPNLSTGDATIFSELLLSVPKQVGMHPRFKPLEAKVKLMRSRSGKLSRYQLTNTAGKAEEVESPNADYWVLNIYDATTSKAREDHLLIRRAMEFDSLFDGVPVISVGSKASEEAWLNYQKTNNFPWPHYRESPTTKASLVEKAGLYPGATYILLNAKNRIEGVYDNVYLLGSAVLLRKRPSKP